MLQDTLKASHRSKTNNVNSSQPHKRKHQDFDKVSTIHSQKTNTIMNELTSQSHARIRCLHFV